MNSAKQTVQVLLQRLPDDCTLEDIQYHLYVAEKVLCRSETAASQGTLTQAQVEARLEQQFAAMAAEDYLSRRPERADKAAFLDALAKVPGTEPATADRF